MGMPTDQDYDRLEDNLTALVTALIPTIRDEYRAYDDCDDDSEPSMLLTVGADDALAFGWQTGDNSFTGGAYGFPLWGIGSVYRDSDPAGVAREIVDEIAEQFHSGE